MKPTPRRVLLACLLAAWAALIVSCGLLDYSYDVSGGYRVIRSSRDQVQIVPQRGWNDATPRIPPKVLEVAWDERFVLAKQQHLKDGKPGWWTYSYWILDVTKPECFGPFTAEEFAARRAELGVPDGLELKHVTSFIPKTDEPAVEVSWPAVILVLVGGVLGLLALVVCFRRLVAYLTDAVSSWGG
jgi:hypothetical protein